MKSLSLSTLPIALLISSLLGPASAHATLGEPEASIENVRRATRTARSPVMRRNSGSATFTVHELKDTGGSIREYVSASGVVFAVVYEAHRSPPLRSILGGYESEFKRLEKARALKLRTVSSIRGRRIESRVRSTALDVSSPRLIAHRGGHMRRLRGRFIDPNLIPAGVSLNDIQ